MPFEPLNTDEELAEAPRRKNDFEAQLMSGCSTIGVSSIITYFITIWPFTRFPEWSVQGLLAIFAFGAFPACLFGIFLGRKFTLAGSSGFFGGALAAAVFMHLRLQQTMLGFYSRDSPRPEYPESFAAIIPILWFVVASLIAWIFCKREPHQT